jgi:large subunit ribosomal protein L22
MEVKAIAKSVRISPRKLRLVAEAVKHLSIDDAYAVLEVTHKRAAQVIQKTLKSAVANAVTNANLDKNNLQIVSVTVNESQAFKRFRPSTRGRIHPYKKRGSHLTIILKEKAVVAASALVKKSAAKVEKTDEKKEEKK